ncbi:MAG: hypothetical protein WAU53_12880 [Rhodoplanes sp.]
MIKSAFWLVLGIVIGGVIGWYAALPDSQVRPGESFAFIDRLSEPGASFLLVHGTWQGANLANKINTVRILCNGHEKTCEMSQADVLVWNGKPYLNLYNKSFRITKLDAQSVIAEPLSQELCIRQTLAFDRTARAVTFVRTKFNQEDACSMVQNEPVTLFLGDPGKPGQ